MSTEKSVEQHILPHHEQSPLCTTRLPYRQGRKLTAVKVYTINDESNHLLIFGVPSLNLRQETESLCLHFGKLLQFYVSTDHPAEPFTETYHARYEKIQSARIAKRMIDTKNFYGGSLHVCYAPELETIEETRAKLLQRKKNVIYRLTNIKKESESKNDNVEAPSIISEQPEITDNHRGEHIVNEISSLNSIDDRKLYMGATNVIYLDKNKRSSDLEKFETKKFKPCFVEEPTGSREVDFMPIEVVDCTSANKEIVSNINDALNFNKFGNEIIRKVDVKPLNRIIFRNNKI